MLASLSAHRSPPPLAGEGRQADTLCTDGEDPALSEREELTAFAIELADAADRISMRYFRRRPRVDRKPDRTFVTQADTAIELELRERIERKYPAHGVLAEEYGDRTSNQETRSLIDPIDATHSYMRGLPIFSTLIALERAVELGVAVMSAPALRKRWHAIRGGGARPAKRPLPVSAVSPL